jgi:hypothetical protein
MCPATITIRASFICSKQEIMNLQEARHVIDALETDPDAARVFGDVHETADGTTVIPVTKGRGAARPAGVFVVKDGAASWVPAVDGERVAMMGILVGLVAATLAGVAMVRRPPWPDLHGDISSLPRFARPLRAGR